MINRGLGWRILRACLDLRSVATAQGPKPFGLAAHLTKSSFPHGAAGIKTPLGDPPQVFGTIVNRDFVLPMGTSPKVQTALLGE